MKFLSPTLFLLLSLASIAGGADFTVTTTMNGGPGSLRQAILDANATPNAGGKDRIIFNIPGAGVHIINVSSGELPGITDPVIIDGYTQPGARPNTLAVGNDAIILIQIDNTQQNGFIGTGLLISGGTSIVRGLSVTGFGSYGISLRGPGAANIIEGNFIGLKPDGQTVGKVNVGIEAATPGNMIGGTSPAARNVIVGATSNGTISNVGVWVTRQPNTVSGNYIGTDASGSRPLNHHNGVRVEGGNGGVVIGGTTPGAGNLISANFAGVQVGYRTGFRGAIYEVPANGVEITGNLIGVMSDGKTPLGSPEIGVYIVASANTAVGDLTPGARNVIAFNGSAGVSVSGSQAINNKILSNSIYGRGGPGIDLGGNGPSSNDPMDTDEGANHLQNYPIVSSTVMSGGSLAIQGTLHSSPNTQFTIQLFSDSYDVLTPGQAFLGTTTATTDSNGNATFSASVTTQFGPEGVNATATDPAGNTSEFFLRPSRFRNLSTRARTQPGDAALIGGFITSGFGTPEIIVRAVGPSLTSGGVPVSDRLADPTLEIYRDGQLIGSNDNWRDDPAVAAEVEKHGLAPANELEPAMVIYPGNFDAHYTAVVRGKDNASGIGLVEFYDVTGTTRRLANMSTRGLVQAGDNVMIGGLILLNGHGPTHVVARAIGPSLTSAGIANPLADPTLELRNSNGTVLASNDNWQQEQAAELNAIGLAPTHSAEAAILALLDPGAYTAIVRGKGDAAGIALVEFYQLP